MSEELNDEVVSINSIYGDNTLSQQGPDSLIYILILPAQPSISLRLEFPADYPDAPPSILGTHHVGDDIAKGVGNTIVELVRAILADIYIPGSPCIFDLIEESGQRLSQLSLDQSGADATLQEQASEEHGWAESNISRHHVEDPDVHFDQQYTTSDLGDPPPWVLSDPITEKKSVFLARAAAVSSPDEAKAYLAHLLSTDKKAAKATHNITAWRIRRPDGVQYQDCDDDGEDAAGGRLLHLLELMNVWGAMVVVSRWYGGVKLGPDRFRIINQCAREAIVRGGFVESEGDGKEGVGSKKKGRK